MWALQDVRLPTGAAADIVVDGDRIARLEAGAADGLAERIQCSGKLVLPGFIDGHVHLDKVLIRDELREHDGTLGGAIAWWVACARDMSARWPQRSTSTRIGSSKNVCVRGSRSRRTL